MSDEPHLLQLWVRTEKAQVFGPLSPGTVELLLDNGIITGRVQVSLDGNTYLFPGRLPGVRMAFPRALWGDQVEPGEAEDARWAQVVLPPALPLVPGSPTPAPSGRGPAQAPAAGPALRQGPPRGPVPGPGARAAPPVRPPNPPPAVRPPEPPRVPPRVPAAPVAPPVMAPPVVARARPPVDAAEAPTPPDPSLRAQAVAPAPAPPPASSASVVAAAGMPSSGDLALLPAMRVYVQAAVAEATGLWTLQLPDRALQVHFKRGAPDFIDSNHQDDSLPAFLVAQGLATAQQLAQAEAAKARFGGELLPALFGLGLLNPNAVFQQIAGRATAILFRALTAERGTFTFAFQELPASKSLPLGNRWALYLEQLRRVPAPDVLRRMLGAMQLPVMRSGGMVPLEDLKLQPQEARALTFFDGVRSLNELVADHPMEADVLVRTAWMLQAVDAVAFSGEVAPAPPPPEGPAAGMRAQFTSSPSSQHGASATSAPPPPRVASAPVAIPGVPPVAASPSGQSLPPPGVPGPPPARPAGPAFPGTPRQASGVIPPGPPPPAPPPPRPPSQAGGPVAAARVVVTAPSPRAPTGPVAPAPPGAPGGPPPQAAAPPGAVRPPSAVLGGAAGPAPATQSTDVAELQALLARMRGLSYLEVLGVTRDADAGAVKQAYFRHAKTLHPDTIAPGSPEALVRVKADLFALIGDAHRTLSDPQLRADYLAELDSGGKGEKVDVAQLLLAEELFQKGRNLVKARKFAEAVKVLDDAIAANGQEGEYFGWRGFARFFTEPDRAKGHAVALKDLDLALKMNPNAAPVYYFHGFLWKLMGDLQKAKSAFRRCVELDPRHVDAQRELRLMK